MSRKQFIGAAVMVVGALLYTATAARNGRLEAAGGVDPQPTLFLVELSHDGEQIFFNEVTGLSPAIPRPSQAAGKVQLRRGFTLSRDLWDWRVRVLAGDPAAKTQVTIRLLDNTLQEVARWTLNNAFPEAVIDSVENGAGYEELVLAHNGLTMVVPAAP